MSGPVVLALRALLAISLYAFLAWAFFSLWREIKQQGILLSLRRVPPLTLTVSRQEHLTQEMYFTQGEIVIGRDPACQCPIDDDAVSAHHARLSYHHGQWWLEDLGSMNGVFLNRQKMAMPTVVISKDEFSCGETQFTITMTDETTLAPTRKSAARSREET